MLRLRQNRIDAFGRHSAPHKLHAHKAESGVSFIDAADRLDPEIIFANAFAAQQRSLAIVSGTRVNLHRENTANYFRSHAHLVRRSHSTAI